MYTCKWPCLWAVLGAWVAFASAQELPRTPLEAADAPGAETEMIQLNFPESLQVQTLVKYVSARLDLNILYDESVGRKRVMIQSPAPIPKDSLLGLLKSVLKMSQLSLVEGDQPGWLQIVESEDLLAATDAMDTDPERLAATPGSVPISHIFPLEHLTPEAVTRHIQPFLSKPGGNTFTLPDRNLLIVTDYADNVRRMAEIIQMVDQPGPPATIRFVAVEHLSPVELSRQVEALLQQKRRVAGRTERGKLTLTPQARTSRIAVVSTGDAADEALELIRSLDVPTEIETRTHRLKYITPSRIDRLAQQLQDPSAGSGRYDSTIDAESGMLIVSAPPDVHERIAQLIEQLDVPALEEAASPVRFYKLLNTTAAEVLGTIRSLESGAGDLSALSLDALGPGGEGFTGPNVPPAGPGSDLPTPPAYRPTDPEGGEAEGPEAAETDVPPRRTARTGDAVVTADPNTNTIIVVAPPPIQRVYERLIRLLDRRRPQVLIEVIMVTLDTTDSFSLGVEISGADRGDDSEFLTFSSFGLSTVDADTGALALNPGVGFNGVLLSPDLVDVVVRALATNGRAKVVSAPKVLANDNSPATLSSVSEAPFTSVNASETVSTTSFAGYASAGTTVSVTPHISEGAHLQLDYSITLNSFTGEGGGGVPPPRQTNSISSNVTIPDGHAVVVGGLKRQDISQSESEVPGLGEIPGLEWLVGSRSRNRSESTLFVFIRPVILRDDQFEDLKYLSERDLEKAELPANLPRSEPMLMRSSAALGDAGRASLTVLEDAR